MKKSELLEKVRFPELTKKVLKQLSARYWEIWKRPKDYRNPENGVTGFIYDDENEDFVNKNFKVIAEVITDYEEENEERLYRDLNLANWLSWFALEPPF